MHMNTFREKLYEKLKNIQNHLLTRINSLPLLDPEHAAFFYLDFIALLAKIYFIVVIPMDIGFYSGILY